MAVIFLQSGKVVREMLSDWRVLFSRVPLFTVTTLVVNRQAQSSTCCFKNLETLFA